MSRSCGTDSEEATSTFLKKFDTYLPNFKLILFHKTGFALQKVSLGQGFF